MELFIKTEKFMDQLDTDFTETLQKGLKDFKATLKKNIDDIKPRDQYVVLVAGKMTQLLLCNVFSRIHFKVYRRWLYEYKKNKPEAGILEGIILCVENLWIQYNYNSSFHKPKSFKNSTNRMFDAYNISARRYGRHINLSVCYLFLHMKNIRKKKCHTL